MSTHITGKLIVAGEYPPEDCPHGATELARIIVVMPREVLREVKTLPMYEDVAVIKTEELAALRADRERLREEIESVRKGAAKVCRELRAEVARLQEANCTVIGFDGGGRALIVQMDGPIIDREWFIGQRATLTQEERK